jgi:uncharacterized protein involved in exopolysaccharide biosynthesis
MDLRFYLRRFLRRLPWFLLLLAIGTAAGVTAARMLPPVYVAEARLLYESEQIPDELAASTVRTQATEHIQIIQQRILTRANLIDLANRLQIYAERGNGPAQRLTPDEIVEDLRARIVIAVTGGDTRSAQATIIRVGFRDPSPILASAVANEIVTMILDQSVRMRTTVAGQTLEFFQQEVQRLDRELANRSARILEFQNANRDALPDGLDFRRRQQETEQERLLQIERTEAALTERRARLVELFESTGQVAPSDEALTPEQRQLRDLRNSRAQALAIYSPENPRLRMLDAQIASLEARLAGQAAESGDETASPQVTMFDLQLADIDSQLETLTVEKARVTDRLEELARNIAATPGNAIALATLEREFANVQTQYNQAVASRARAETGDTIEAMSRGQRISVIEQAVAPREPSQPNRRLIAAGGIAGGAALGLGLIGLLEFTSRRIRRPADLTSRLQITPIATLPYLRAAGETRRKVAVAALAVLLVLTAIPAGLWAVDTYFRPLDQLMAPMVRAVGLEDMLDRLRESLRG